MRYNKLKCSARADHATVQTRATTWYAGFANICKLTRRVVRAVGRVIPGFWMAHAHAIMGGRL